MSNTSATIELGGRTIGRAGTCYVIAEAGVNHNGSLESALRLVDAAGEAGVDAVKFQTFDPTALTSDSAPLAPYQESGSRARGQREMLSALMLSPADHRALQAHCAEVGVTFLSSPFDSKSAELLSSLGVEAFKIPSGEVVNHGFLDELARLGVPLLMSTGMCTLDEVGDAVGVIRAAGDPPLVLLHCVSCYPTAVEDCNLNAMQTLREAFACPVGWSDHTLGIDVAIAAAALGACVIEKHLTLDRTLDGPDHKASLEPDELGRMVRGVRSALAALGTGEKVPVAAERAVADLARKSLLNDRAIAAGHVVSSADLVTRRPGTGVLPNRVSDIVGRRLARAVEAEAMVCAADLDRV